MRLDDEARRIKEEVHKNFRYMPLSKKLEYFFMYYKWVIALAVFLVILGIGLRGWIENLRTTQILGIMAINCNPEAPEDIGERVKADIGGKEKYEEVDVFRNVTADMETGELDYQSQMLFITMLQAREFDVILMPEAAVKGMEDTAAFADLGGITGLSSGTDGPFLVLPEGSKVYEYFGFYYEPVYVGLLDGCKNEENALLWIRQLAGISEAKTQN